MGKEAKGGRGMGEDGLGTGERKAVKKSFTALPIQPIASHLINLPFPFLSSPILSQSKAKVNTNIPYLRIDQFN